MRTNYDEEFYTEFSKVFRNAMREQGYTTNRLANEVDEQYTTIKRIEKGEAFLVHHLVWIKRILGISIEKITYSRGNNEQNKTDFGSFI